MTNFLTNAVMSVRRAIANMHRPGQLEYEESRDEFRGLVAEIHRTHFDNAVEGAARPRSTPDENPPRAD